MNDWLGNHFLIVFLLIVVLTVAIGFFLTRSKYSAADWGSPFKNNLSGLVCWFVYKYHGLQKQYINLPDKGGAIIVSNHVSGLDPLILVAASSRPLRFLIAREQYDRFGLTWIFRMAGCIPVERDKRPDRALRAAIKAVDAGEVVALFPHGKIHRDTDPPVKIKGGAVKLAEYTGCQIFPVRIDGVRAQGHIFFSLILPGSVQLTYFSSMLCHPDLMYQNLRQLQEMIESRELKE